MEYAELRKNIASLKLQGKASKFMAKLDFDQRCEILALYRIGISRAALAAAYGIDPRTVTHIYTKHSIHYKDVRAEETKLGQEAFLKQYITENAWHKLSAVKIEDDEVEPIRAMKGAGRYKGVHIVKNEYCEYEHRVLIEWCEKTLDNAGAGWYYRDMDGATPMQWLHNGDESRMTSAKCLAAVRENLMEV